MEAIIMAETATLTYEIREKSGTGAARAVRRDGKVPSIIYGGDAEPQQINIELKAIQQQVEQQGFFSRIFSLEANGKKIEAIARDIQTHPVTDNVLHVDFQRVNQDQEVNVRVPVSFVNFDRSPGIKLGGSLNVIIRNLQVTCKVKNMPKLIEVSLEGVKSGESVLTSKTKLPEGVKITKPNRDKIFATITKKGGKKAASDEEADNAED